MYLFLRNVLIFEWCALFYFIDKNICHQRDHFSQGVKTFIYHSSHLVLWLDFENYSFHFLLITDDLKVCYEIRYNSSASSFVGLDPKKKNANDFVIYFFKSFFEHFIKILAKRYVLRSYISSILIKNGIRLHTCQVALSKWSTGTLKRRAN